MTNYAEMTDEELAKEYDRLWRTHMYYMAAEGNWSAEREAREANDKEYWACVRECSERGMPT